MVGIELRETNCRESEMLGTRGQPHLKTTVAHFFSIETSSNDGTKDIGSLPGS